jgi:hypothetical protein
MKFLKFFVIFLTIHTLKSEKLKSLVPQAVSGILKNYFTKETSQIDVVYVGEKNQISENFITEILQQNQKENFKFRMFKFDDEEILLQNSSLVLFDSVETFKESSINMTWQNNKKVRFKHLVHILGATVDDIKSQIEEASFEIDYVDFLVNEKHESIDLLTSFMFTKQACRKNQFMTINRFHRKSLVWENSTFYPEKYRNFYKCNLTVAAMVDEEVGDKIDTGNKYKRESCFLNNFLCQQLELLDTSSDH